MDPAACANICASTSFKMAGDIYPSHVSMS